MVNLTTAEAMKRQIERARNSQLFVQNLAWRRYRVTNREKGTRYEVEFFKRDRQRFGHCTCKAGVRNMACKHLVAAAAFHLYLAAQKRLTGQACPREPMPGGPGHPSGAAPLGTPPAWDPATTASLPAEGSRQVVDSRRARAERSVLTHTHAPVQKIGPVAV